MQRVSLQAPGVLLLLIALGWISSGPVHAATYTLVDLGTFSDQAGRTESQPAGINNLGAVVASNLRSGNYRALLYGGAWTNLGTLGGYESFGLGINDSGAVVGYSLNTNGFNRAFLWTANGTNGPAGNPRMKDLGTLGGDESTANAINEAGQITGFAQTASLEHAFVYSGGVMKDIGGLIKNLPNSYGQGINSAGHVTGIAYDSNWDAAHAFYYNGTTAVDIGNLGGLESYGISINDTDHICGFFTDQDYLQRAFHYYAGVMTDLGTLGGNYSYADNINNAGTIVGGATTDLLDTTLHAFIWANNTMSDLNGQLDATGAGWELAEAVAINDLGQIVGVGTLNGADHFFLLNPLLPVITNQPVSKTATLNADVTFTVGATSPWPLSYQWLFNGVNLDGATNATLSLTGIQPASAGTYSVLVANANGVTPSTTATLTVNHPPIITNQPVSQSVLLGGNATFVAGATGPAPLRYQWLFNGTNLAGATTNTYTRTNAQAAHAGGYTVIVTNTFGAVTSTVATLTVNLPPAVTTNPVSQSVLAEGSVTFGVAATGTLPLGYQWFFNSNSIPGATGASLTLSNIQPSQAGTYSVVVTNAYGTATAAAASLTVNVPPGISTQPVSQSVTISNNVSFAVGASGTAPIRYQWRFNGTNLSGATSNVYTRTAVQPSQAGAYTVVVSNNYGAVTSAVATLTVNYKPGITTQPLSQTVLAGSNTTFSVVANGVPAPAYQWRLNGTDIPGASAGSLPLASVQATNAGGYSVVVTNILGSVTSSVATLTVVFRPAITNQPQSQTVVSNSNVSFSVGASGTATLAYQWRFNGTNLSGATGSVYTRTAVQPSQAGAYTVVVSNNYGAVTSAVATLTVNYKPSITTQPLSKTVVAGSNTTFSVVANGVPAPAYQWRLNGTNLAGAAASSLTLTSVQAMNAGGYSVVVTNILGSVTSSVATLTVVFRPTITNQPQSQTVVSNSNVSFSVGASGTATLAYQWRFNGTNISKATASVYTRTAVQPSQAGAYTVVVTNIYGAVTSAVATLTVTYKPGITTQPLSQTVVAGSNTTFSVVANGVPAPAYQWRLNGINLAGAAASSLTLTNVQATNAGGYSVVVTNTLGSVTSSVATLTVVFRPAITNQPLSQAVPVGGTAAFTVGAAGTAPLRYQWRFNGTNIASATNSTYTKTNVQLVNAGGYSAVVTNLYGAVTSIVATLTVGSPVAPMHVNEVPAITSMQLVGSNVLLSFTTAARADYSVESTTNLDNGSWESLVSGIAGNGYPHTVTNVGGATLQERFYRVLRSLRSGLGTPSSPQ